MKINPEEITRIIQDRIGSYQPKLEMVSTGTVVQVGDGIARIYGIEKCMYAELLEFESGIFGMALNLEPDNVGAVLLGDDTKVKEGETVRCTGRIMEVPVGEEMIGRIVNPLGQPLDGKGPIKSSKFRLLEEKAKSVVERQPVKEPLMTGWKGIDAMIPIGRGQRELIIGDRGTGKTAVAIDTLLNQKDTGVICIYVAIGQKQSSIARVHKVLQDAGAMKYTIIVSASASDPAPLQYIAPYAGTAIGEEIRDKGGHACIVYDDLSKHAAAYRQLSLLLRRPPGREAYPGDVFNLHSRLLERAAKLSQELGGGSLTSLPIIETQAGDVSAYIPTNVISITDGQIYLLSSLFYSGVRPAIDVGISVSRVGGKAQTKAMRQVAGKLRLDLAQYRELAAFAQFGSELDKSALAQISRGQRMVELLKQGEHVPIPFVKQIIAIFAGTSGFLDDVPVADVLKFEANLLQYMESAHPAIVKDIVDKKEITDDTRKALSAAIEKFKKERM
jgi:F-type H+/Na+-transporting ATPase subunit alpha